MEAGEANLALPEAVLQSDNADSYIALNILTSMLLSRHVESQPVVLIRG
jgi:hypothetical protein